MNYTAAVITVSDKGYRGEREDTSGPNLVRILKVHGYAVAYTSIVADEKGQIRAELLKCADELKISLILTTGGTGFSPRDVTPEITCSIVERLVPGIPEAMRAESMRITSRACLSRSAAGIRGRSLIVNLPGSKKAAEENLLAVIDPIEHGLEMLLGAGSANCADSEKMPFREKDIPSMDQWLQEAKAHTSASKVGMYLIHNGVVRETARAAVRDGCTDTEAVRGMLFSYDREALNAAVADAEKMQGVYYVRVWLNTGKLSVGEDLMYVLVGGDIRSHTIAALEYLVARIKRECVSETELYSEETPCEIC